MAEESIEQLPLDDWHDQDLLTKDEAAGRLEERIAETAGRLAELSASGSGAAAEVEGLERRLAALRSAVAALRG